MENPSESYTDYRRKKHEQWNTSSEVIQGAVLKATGSAMAEQQRIIAGETNEVYSATTEAGPEVIVRIHHGPRNRFEKERWALDRCAEVGVPAPMMLFVESLNDTTHICVESKLGGESLDQKNPELIF